MDEKLYQMSKKDNNEQFVQKMQESITKINIKKRRNRRNRRRKCCMCNTQFHEGLWGTQAIGKIWCYRCSCVFYCHECNAYCGLSEMAVRHGNKLICKTCLPPLKI